MSCNFITKNIADTETSLHSCHVDIFVVANTGGTGTIHQTLGYCKSKSRAAAYGHHWVINRSLFLCIVFFNSFTMLKKTCFGMYHLWHVFIIDETLLFVLTIITWYLFIIFRNIFSGLFGLNPSIIFVNDLAFNRLIQKNWWLCFNLLSVLLSHFRFTPCYKITLGLFESATPEFSFLIWGTTVSCHLKYSYFK